MNTPTDVPTWTDPDQHCTRILEALLARPISRRVLIASLIGVSGAVPLTGWVARAAARFQTSVGPHGATVSIGPIQVWRIDARWFDGNPVVHAHHGRDIFRVTLQDALFPGTDLSARLELKARRTASGWAASLDLPDLAFHAIFNLELWLLGYARAHAPAQIRCIRPAHCAHGHISNVRGAATFGADWAFDVASTNGVLCLSGHQVAVRSLRLELASRDIALAEPRRRRTRHWLALDGDTTMSLPTGVEALTLSNTRPTTFIETSAERTSIVLSQEGAPASLTFEGAMPVRVALNDVVARTEHDHEGSVIALTAELAPNGWHQFEGTAVEFAGAGGTGGIAYTYDATQPDAASAPIIHARRFVVSVPGCDAAMFALRPPHTGAGTVRAYGADVRQLAKRYIDLDGYDLILRRANDAMFCTIRFRGLALRFTWRGWMLVRKASQTETKGLIEFDLGSQHLLEEAIYLSKWKCSPVPPGTGRCPGRDFPISDELAARAIILAQNRGTPIPGALTLPVDVNGKVSVTLTKAVDLLRTTPAFNFQAFKETKELKDAVIGTLDYSSQLEEAGPSHLLFELTDDIPLTARDLLGWVIDGDDTGSRRSRPSPFVPVLPRRALKAGTLKLPSRSEEDFKISNPQSLQHTLGPDLEYATGIEAPARLVVSPIAGDHQVVWRGSSARFSTPQPPRGNRYELWHARLENAAIRAVYTPDAKAIKDWPAQRDVIKVDVFNPPDPFRGGSAEFRASLDKRDRHELVALSALYGYEALCGTKQVYQCADDGGPCSADKPCVRPWGAFQPTPIDAELLLLTSQGASFRYRGYWDPPAEKTGAGGALTITRYEHRAQIGRDTYTRVQYRGALFPLSIPCILNKVTERRICLVPLTVNGTTYQQFTAQLVQRFFIHVPSFTRAFPSVDQPHAGRLWGHASTSMKEFTTPDLADPVCTEVAGLGQSAFWPCILDGTDVLFEYFEESTGARYKGPLVFVDNHVIHTADQLKSVFADWRGHVVDELKTDASSWSTKLRFYAEVKSARLPYIIGEHGENTDLETQRVLLGVNGQQDTGFGDELNLPYTPNVTPRMEAQSQPPFYPVRRRALVSSTQIATITGNPRDQYLIDYDPVFRDAGLSLDANAGQIFARFAGRGAAMNFGSDTSRSGGFVSPTSMIVWISKSRGLIGGPKKNLSPMGPLVTIAPARPLARPLGPPPSIPDQTSAHRSDLNPEEYLYEFIGDAKLCGVVKLVDVLRFVLKATGTEIPTIKQEALFDLAIELLRAVVPQLATLLRDALQKLQDPEFLPAPVQARLQPHFQRLKAAIDAAQASLEATSPDAAAVLAAGKEVGSAVNRLQAEIKAIANEPTSLLPPEAQEAIRIANEALSMLRQFVPPDHLAAIVKSLIAEMVSSQVDALLTRVLELASESPAYRGLYAAVSDIRALVSELQASAGDVQKLLQALATNILQRFSDAADRLALQAGMLDAVVAQSCMDLMQAVQDFVVALKPAITSVPGTDPLPHINAANNLRQLLNSVDAVISQAEKQLITPQLPEGERRRLEEFASRARQSASGISDLLNGYIDRLNQIEEVYKEVGTWKLPDEFCKPNPSKLIQDRAKQVRLVIGHALDLAPQALKAATKLAEVAKTLSELASPPPAAFADAAVAEIRCAPGSAPWGSDLSRAANQMKQFVIGSQLSKLTTAVKTLAAQLANQPNALSKALASTMQSTSAALATIETELAKLFDDPSWQNFDCAFVTAIRARYPDVIAKITQVSESYSLIEQTFAQFDPNQAASQVRAQLQSAVSQLRDALEGRVRQQLDSLEQQGIKLLCGDVAAPLRDKLQELQNARLTSYLSVDATRTLDELRTAFASCNAPSRTWLADAFAKLSRLVDLLARSLSLSGLGRLVDLDRIVDDMLSALGVPTRLRVSYDWTTTVHAYPSGEAAIFEPVDDGQLTISAILEASLRGGSPTASIEARLAPFFIHLFGKSSTSNFLSIQLAALTLTAKSGQAIDCRTDVVNVQPGPALGFVANLASVFGGRSGFRILPTFHGIKVGYEYSRERELLGGFLLQNIAFSIYAELPFDNSPVRLTMALASKVKPFLLSAGIYGGGGFLSIQTRADTLEILEASFEYGLVTGFEFGPVSGSGRITAGVYIRMGGRNPVIAGFFCAAGECSIAGIITMSASLRVTLAYYPNENATRGDAEFQFKFSIGFLDFSYSTTVAYGTAGDGGQKQAGSGERVMLALGLSDTALDGEGPLGTVDSSGAPALADALSASAAVSDDTWNRYWSAFRPLTAPSLATCASCCTPASTLRMNSYGTIA